MKRAIWILWPSFVTAGAGALLFFHWFDPLDLAPVLPLELSRTAGYSVGFLFFWALGAASSAFSLFLQRRP